MTKQFKIGQLGIANDFDCPESKMVAVIIKVDETQIYFRYLGKEMEQRYRKFGYAELDEFTLLNEFGVICEFEGKHFRCTQTKDSTAKYPDGKIRRWQDNNPNCLHQVSEKAVYFIDKR